MKKKLTKKWLKNKFNSIGTTIMDVAIKANCNEKTIRRNLKKFNLSTRSMSENASYKQSQHDNIQNTSKEIIYGELLGDGNLTSHCNYSAYYQHSSSEKQYLKWLSKQLKLKCGKIYKNKNNTYHFATNSYLKLKEIYDKFYINNVKIIPKDLKLTPLMALHWYLGDGCKNSKTIITIGTYSFNINDLKRIMLQLKKFKPRLYYQCKNMSKGYGYRLALHSNFLKWIGKCPKEIKNIYGYKW